MENNAVLLKNRHIQDPHCSSILNSRKLYDTTDHQC